MFVRGYKLHHGGRGAQNRGHGSFSVPPVQLRDLRGSAFRLGRTTIAASMNDTRRSPGVDDERLRALMAAYQAGQMEAFDRLYSALEDELRRFFAARCRDLH